MTRLLGRAPRRAQAASFLAAAAIAASPLLAGCGGSRPGANPQLEKRFEDIEERLDFLQDFANSFGALEGTVTNLQAEVDSLRLLAGDSLSPDQRANLENFAGQADALAKLQAELDATRQEVAALKSGSGSSSAPAGVAAGVAAEAAKFQPRAQPSAGGSSARQPRAVAVSSSAGSYYMVKSGDTLSGIASRNNISVSSLARANKISPDARLATNQRIWIPAR